MAHVCVFPALTAVAVVIPVTGVGAVEVTTVPFPS
jgi:hypothetical protein